MRQRHRPVGCPGRARLLSVVAVGVAGCGHKQRETRKRSTSGCSHTSARTFRTSSAAPPPPADKWASTFRIKQDGAGKSLLKPSTSGTGIGWGRPVWPDLHYGVTLARKGCHNITPPP
jgi:hypothetical protein